jgi:hypothetical protein
MAAAGRALRWRSRSFCSDGRRSLLPSGYARVSQSSPSRHQPQSGFAGGNGMLRSATTRWSRSCRPPLTASGSRTDELPAQLGALVRLRCEVENRAGELPHSALGHHKDPRWLLALTWARDHRRRHLFEPDLPISVELAVDEPPPSDHDREDDAAAAILTLPLDISLPSAFRRAQHLSHRVARGVTRVLGVQRPGGSRLEARRMVAIRSRRLQGAGSRRRRVHGRDKPNLPALCLVRRPCRKRQPRDDRVCSCTRQPPQRRLACCFMAVQGN